MSFSLLSAIHSNLGGICIGQRGSKSRPVESAGKFATDESRPDRVAIFNFRVRDEIPYFLYEIHGVLLRLSPTLGAIGHDSSVRIYVSGARWAVGKSFRGRHRYGDRPIAKKTMAPVPSGP